MGMRNHEIVPVDLIQSISKIRLLKFPICFYQELKNFRISYIAEIEIVFGNI